MIKVLLVDDEEMIRQGIADSIDWEKLNMKVIGHAEDGEDALEIFTEHTPQLILTDIKMPFMNGLELVEKVKSQNPDTYIIIISGYDEFHYAQKAIKLGAQDFILKPIDLDDLEKMLSKISQDYDSKLHKENEEKVLKEKVDNSLHILQASFLKDLLFSNVDPDSIAEKVKELQINEASYGNVLLVKVDENENTKNVLSNLSGDEEDLFVLEMGRTELIMIILGATEDSVRRKMKLILNKIRNEEQTSLTTAYGNITAPIKGLSQSYREAMEALEYKFILGSGKTISFESVKGKVKEYSSIINSKDYEIIYGFDFTNKQSIKRDVNVLMDNIKSAGRDSYLYSQMIISNIYMEAIKTLREYGGSVEEVFEHPINMFKQLASRPTLEMVQDELLITLFKIADYIDDRKHGSYSYLIEKARQYISQNFQNANLSIDTVARHLNISNSYFSILFKQETSQTFVDYLTAIRIEKAKTLLKASGYRTYEISDQVGFNNPTYFSTTFKKHTGHSPSEYRKLV